MWQHFWAKIGPRGAEQTPRTKGMFNMQVHEKRDGERCLWRQVSCWKRSKTPYTISHIFPFRPAGLMRGHRRTNLNVWLLSIAHSMMRNWICVFLAHFNYLSLFQVLDKKLKISGKHCSFTALFGPKVSYIGPKRQAYQDLRMMWNWSWA